MIDGVYDKDEAKRELKAAQGRAGYEALLWHVRSDVFKSSEYER